MLVKPQDLRGGVASFGNRLPRGGGGGSKRDVTLKSRS